jgi:CheY-like chemotaxis protein
MKEHILEPLVLIVDDEEMTRKLLRLMLEREGFAIAEAEDGLDALEMIAEQRPDLVIMDVMMPNLDGFTTCQQLRGQPETADLPIILLSARVQHEAIRAGLQAGADRYITKPISKADLVAAVTELLEPLREG